MENKLRNLLQETRLSPSEKLLIKYILKNIRKIENMSIEQIAKQTYVSPALLVRLAKKLGYKGWREMR